MKKVFRVTVAVDIEGNVLESGVMFSNGVDASGRIPIKLPKRIVQPVLDEAQAALDAMVADFDEVPAPAITTALHKRRSAEQDREVASNERAAILEDIKAKKRELRALDDELYAKRAEKAAE